MEGDLLLAGVASALMRNAKPATGPVTPPTASGPVTAQFSSEQLDQLAGALMQGIRNIELPTPQVQVPPAQVQFPSNLQLSFSDAELARIAEAIKPKPTEQVSRLIETRVMTLNFNGSAIINSQFPTLQRMSAFQFSQDYYLVASTLSCSIVNTSTPVAGLFLARDLGSIININQQSDTETASDVFISQLTHQNSTQTTIAPLSRTNTIAFGGDTQFIRVQAGTRLALYACGTSDANNFYTAVANLHVTPINP
jgi:ubiquinone biosynthesis protein UbiJ